MDEKLKNALDFSNYMVTLNNQRRILLEQFKENTKYYYGGGQFTIETSLMSHLSALSNVTNNAILLDDNSIPILVEDVTGFLAEIAKKYDENLRIYYQEYQNIKNSRSVEKLVDDE